MITERDQQDPATVVARFLCCICSKTFYNAVALQNHKKIHHGFDDINNKLKLKRGSSTAPEYPENNSVNCDGGFIFKPLRDEAEETTLIRDDGLVAKQFVEDTTYIIIKVKRDEEDADAAKKRRLEGVVRISHLKPLHASTAFNIKGPFTCSFPSVMRPDHQCKQKFYNCCDYSMHNLMEHSYSKLQRNTLLRCQVCEKFLDRQTNSNVAFVAKIKDTGQWSYTCKVCKQTFLESASFDKHWRSAHTKVKPHQCSLCAKRFTQHSGLQQHMHMHSGIRPFACSTCLKSFTQKCSLEQHLRIHSKVKPFKCVICSKLFSQSIHMRQHMRTHTNIQPFECLVCSRRFKQNTHLKFHMRLHTGDMPALLLDGR